MTSDLHQTYVASAANTLLFQIAMPWPGAELKDTLDYVPIDVGQPNEPGLKRTMDIWTAARGSVDDFSVLGFNPPTVRQRSGGFAALGSVERQLEWPAFRVWHQETCVQQAR
jgi:hypothetical protein